MKKLFLWVFIPLLAFVSCSDDINYTETGNDGAEAQRNYPSYFSLMKVPKDASVTKAGVPTTEKTVAKWNDFDVIKIYFMNGSENATLINKVKSVAGAYEELTNLTFKYVSSAENSDVRITFSNHEAQPALNYLAVNWSYLGKQCLAISKSEPTMNLAIANINDLAEVNSPSFKASILREFGHMLGMIYEYQRGNLENPEERVVLNNDNIYEGVGLSENDEKGIYQIDRSYLMEHFYLIDLIDTDAADAIFDGTSIMLPYIPANWIKTTGFSKTSQEMFDKIAEKTNLELSAKDKAYIAQIYKKPDLPEHNRGPKGKVTISLGPTSYYEGWAPVGYRVGWDYRTGTLAERIINEYPTIGVGEYEWTTVNLRIKYQGYSLGYINFNNTMVNHLAGNAFGDDSNTVEKFEQVFGTWATEFTDSDWHYAVSYREDKEFSRNDSNYPADNVAFDLPDATAILQLFGQMPHTTGNVYNDFRNYAFGLPEGTDAAVAQALAQKMPFLNGDYNNNTSGLSLLPLGSMHSHGEGDVAYIYQGHPYAYWNNSAFMTSGTGVKLKMKKNNVQQLNFNFHDSASEGSEIALNQYLFHWGSVRYCRALTDEELGYKLYVDESSNKVVYLKLNQQPESGYVELPRGIERGVALGCLYKDDDKGIYYFIKSWSKIKEEATEIRYNLSVSSY